MSHLIPIIVFHVPSKIHSQQKIEPIRQTLKKTKSQCVSKPAHGPSSIQSSIYLTQISNPSDSLEL